MMIFAIDMERVAREGRDSGGAEGVERAGKGWF